jgi:type I restriction enzyme M protein
VKRRSRINFSFAPERIERLKATPEFQEIATSKKKGKARDEEIRYGKSVQEEILLLLGDMDGRRIYHDQDEFRKLLESVFKGMIKFPPYFWDVMMDALSEEE